MKIIKTNTLRKIDAMGRLTIPKEWRKLYSISAGNLYELCVCKDEESGAEIIGIQVKN